MDLNADLGEVDTPRGWASDSAILAVVSSASIACGGHAGDRASMRRAVAAARAQGVRIGAHPAYPDRAGFGRRPGFAIGRAALRRSLLEQIVDLAEVAACQGSTLAYVKPHGALYTDATRDAALAELIVDAVERLDPGLALMGAPRGEVVRAARGRLRYLAEGFIDRAYDDSGNLVPRGAPGAVPDTLPARLLQLDGLLHGEVKTIGGRAIPMCCDTLCLHGDDPAARETARAARAHLNARGVRVAA